MMAGQRKSGSAPQTGPRAGKAGAKPESPMGEAAMVIDGVPYRLADLSLGELESLEDYVAQPMDEISFGSAKVMAYLVYLVRRRTDPDYSLDDAKSIKIGSVTSEDADGKSSTVKAVGDRPT